MTMNEPEIVKIKRKQSMTKRQYPAYENETITSTNALKKTAKINRQHNNTKAIHLNKSKNPS